MIKLSSSLIATLILSFQFVFGQSGDREIVTQGLQWLSATSNIKLTKRLSWVVEGQFRYTDDFDAQQYQIRTALDIKLNEHFSFVPLGYVYTWIISTASSQQFLPTTNTVPGSNYFINIILDV